MSEEKQKVKIKSKTPKLIAAALVLTAVAAGVSFSFQEESAKFRGMLKNTLKGWLSQEDVKHKRTFEEGDVSFDERRRQKEDLNVKMDPNRKESKKENDLSDLALKDDDGNYKVNASDEERAQAFIKQAEEHLESWRLSAALSLARKVRDLKCSRDLRKKGRYIEKKAQTVMDLTAGVKPDIASDLTKLKVITLSNGNELKGVIEDKGDGNIIVKGSDNMTYSLKQSEIMRIEQVKANDERAKIIAEFDQHYARAKGSRDPLSVFDVGVLGIKNRLEGEGRKSVLEAYDMAYEKGGLKNVVQEHRARTLLAQGIWREDTGNLPIARKKYRECINSYPDSEAAGKAKKLLNYSLSREKVMQAERKRKEREMALNKNTKKESKKEDDIIKERETDYKNKEDEEETSTVARAQTSYGSKFSSKENSKLREADDYYRKALGHMRIAFDNRPSAKSNREFVKAEGLLRKAISIWERVNARHNDQDIEMRILKANEQLYSTLKLRTLA
ncbi:hypothetical protein ACFL6F_00940 [Planctomycetota bacterium]